MTFLDRVLSLGSLFVLLTCGRSSPHAPPQLLGIDWEQWAALNCSVDGHLHLSRPFELPCFSLFEGQAVSPDSAACTAVQANYTDPVFRSEHFGAYMQSQWETCQVTGASCLLDDSDPTNPAAYQSKDCQTGNIAPVYIDVQSVEHVQAAYTFSLKTGIKLSVKNKGHDYKGRSSGWNTLGLWVGQSHSFSALADMTFNETFTSENCNTSYRAITIGTGVEMQQLYAFADQHNVTAIGGYHKTIGTGYFLGGGHSILSPVYGLGVDRVVEIKVVTPDGRFRTVNECEDSDLFWALRGGGGSAFGVVTELTMRVEPQLTLQAAIIKFPANSSNLVSWYELMVNSSLRWGQEGWGGHIAGGSLIHVNPLLNQSAAQASMQVAIDFAVAQGGSGLIDDLPSWNAFFLKYVTSAEVPVGSEIMLGTRLLNTSLFATDSGRMALSAAITNVLPFASPYVVVGTPFLFPYVEGTTSVTPAWRTALWHLGLSGRFYFNSTAQDRQSEYTQIDQHTQVFRDLTPGSGAYFNEGDVYEPDHEQSYWGSNYEKLLEIKKKYDPYHIMNCWQCGMYSACSTRPVLNAFCSRVEWSE
ncbi:uncharacterized protein PHACADRAFT_92497 [Phanerochaete carnosa HHB-10118-sp]|uniref:FAD-binding PCMH-type domain-containing protein n=1 Tax=Phanerochaete carnosa (strain HHB-10118-sp) TaxID=650164 RepID=K5WBW8_PHACS|nr:uncharacterized protein PHACADRAFT_92497 [Phanerochaete carnosa HHB-10118-sp]EKM56474.1 hypothetical protein PHACADRAFT_92497 [Phanerochaete carnosa HHB-10118-sp]